MMSYHLRGRGLGAIRGGVPSGASTVDLVIGRGGQLMAADPRGGLVLEPHGPLHEDLTPVDVLIGRGGQVMPSDPRGGLVVNPPAVHDVTGGGLVFVPAPAAPVVPVVSPAPNAAGDASTSTAGDDSGIPVWALAAGIGAAVLLFMRGANRGR